MPEDDRNAGGSPAPPPVPPAAETRPVDVGLSEGKSIAFAPTAVQVAPATPLVGGLNPAPAPATAVASDGTPSPQSAAAPPAPTPPSSQHE
jgi:hypothetical protein